MTLALRNNGVITRVSYHRKRHNFDGFFISDEKRSSLDNRRAFVVPRTVANERSCFYASIPASGIPEVARSLREVRGEQRRATELLTMNISRESRCTRARALDGQRSRSFPFVAHQRRGSAKRLRQQRRRYGCVSVAHLLRWLREERVIRKVLEFQIGHPERVGPRRAVVASWSVPV